MARFSGEAAWPGQALETQRKIIGGQAQKAPCPDRLFRQINCATHRFFLDDTVNDLADQIKLPAREFEKWLKDEDGKGLPNSAEAKITEPRRFSVPNTGYINFGGGIWGVIAWGLWGYERSLADRWGREGLLVDRTSHTTNVLMEAQLRSPNIYKFGYIGHGVEGGALLPVARWFDYGDSEWLDPTVYTQFGIAEMHLIACHSNDAAFVWKKNVSQAGFLRTVRGEMSIPNAPRRAFELIHEAGWR